jgi:uncharacterized protein YjbI with pentapeptide repeats
MENDNLEKIIKKHQKWLHSGKNDGICAMLSGEDLSGLELKEVVLIEADLSGADFRGANLTKANLKGTNLKGAHLRNAKLRGVNLIDADLEGANLIMANLREGFCRGADMMQAHFLDADIRDANLIDANLSKAKMRRADLRGTSLFNANLSYTDLSNAKLRGANCRGANFKGANLRNADLSKADLTNVDLSDADLSEVDLRKATLARANLHRTKFDNSDLTNLRIDNDSYDQIPMLPKEQFEKTWEYLNFKDFAPKMHHEYAIEFPDEYRMAGLFLLNYFPTFIKSKYPGLKSKFTYNYDENKILIAVYILEGTTDIVEQTMIDFTDIINMKIDPDEYIDDPVFLKELKSELTCAEYCLNYKNKIKLTENIFDPENFNYDDKKIPLSTLGEIMERSFQKKDENDNENIIQNSLM